ncbi:MAG: YceI family protein [Alphaproteobacteria bacterium]|nr:YceI family protein [Alphaproteobacteria bacterium SS10]
MSLVAQSSRFAAGLITAIGLSVASASALAMDWSVDQGASSIGFSGTHAGRDFTGQFEDWDATVTFDPAALDEASVVVTVRTASAATGTLLYDKTLPNSEWFNAEGYPEAVFQASQFRSTGEGQYEANGTLTIKGQEIPLVLPFTLEMGGDSATVTGRVEMDRIALGMGTKSDPNAAWVSQVIPVTVNLSATRSGS